MLDYKDIITKHYALGMKGGEIAAALGNSKSGVNDFLRAFEQCEALSFPLPEEVFGEQSPGDNMEQDVFSLRPRRLRVKYTHRTNLAICSPGISLLRRAGTIERDMKNSFSLLRHR